jgi:hypothetical protein
MKLFLIHDPKILSRIPYYESTIKKIKEIIDPQMDVEIITEPFDLKKKDFKNKIKLEKIQDEDFDKCLCYINIEQISNIEKHKKIYKKIIAYGKPCMIIEDDCVISTDYINNINKFFKEIDYNKFDILFTGFSENNEEDIDIKYIDTRNKYKILISKASYIINPKTAQKLLDYLDIYRYNMKISMSKFIWDNKDIRSIIINKHMFLESSKIGIHPTTINNNNILIFNPEYIELIRIINNSSITEENVTKAKKLFENLKKIESSDVHHIMSIIYHKLKLYDNAKEELNIAIKIAIKKQGYLGKYSELLNNAINISQYNQYDIDEILNTKSKYLII